MSTLQIILLCWCVACVFGAMGVYVGLCFATFDAPEPDLNPFDDERVYRVERLLYAPEPCFHVIGERYLGAGPTLYAAYRNWLSVLPQK